VETRRPGYGNRRRLRLALLCAILVVPACDVPAPLPGKVAPSTRLLVGPAHLDLSVGQTGSFNIAVLGPDDGSSITWSSSNQEVATVSQTGVVTGLSTGRARIIAHMQGLDLPAEATVTVRPAGGPAVGGSDVALSRRGL
jgi:hypothetical protein